MKSIKKFSNKFLHFEIARLRTMYNKLEKEDWCTEQGGKWVTIKGNHICMFKGDTPREALLRTRLSQKDIPKELKERVIKDGKNLKDYINKNERRKELWDKYQKKMNEAPEEFDNMITRRVIMGSFVTDKENPGDIDVIIFTDPKKTLGANLENQSKEVQDYYWNVFNETTDFKEHHDVSIMFYDDTELSRSVLDSLIKAGQDKIRGYGKDHKGVQH